MYTGLKYEDPEAEVMYTFDYANGLLIKITSTDDGSAITLEYNSLQQPIFFVHSNGKKLNVTYTDSGLISYLDMLDGDNTILKSRYVLIILSTIYIYFRTDTKYSAAYTLRINSMTCLYSVSVRLVTQQVLLLL